jgi:Flp pilus assembly pilin Flp
MKRGGAHRSGVRRPAFAVALWRDRRGATAVEYALILGAVMFVIIAGVTLVGSSINDLFKRTAATFAAAPPS